MVEPTHLKNISQNGFIFPNFRGEHKKIFQTTTQMRYDEVSPQNKQIEKQLGQKTSIGETIGPVMSYHPGKGEYERGMEEYYPGTWI